MQEGDNNHVELRAMGKAINKAVTIAEILKRKMPLHQITTLSSCEVVNVYEPLEEGLDTVVNQHYVSCLTITLSRDLKDIDVNDKGYQVRSQHQLFYVKTLFHDIIFSQLFIPFNTM
jgi:DNA-binding protein